MDVLSDEFLENAVGQVLSKLASGQDGDASAEAGWAYYATFADAEGNLSPKAFHDILLATVTKLGGFDALDSDAIPDNAPIHKLSAPLVAFYMMTKESKIQSYRRTGEYEKIEEVVKECKESAARLAIKIAKKAMNSFPLVVDALFRLFDSDKNGTVSKKEFIAAMAIPANPGEAQKTLPYAVFRFLDEDGSNVIEPEEVGHLVTSIISAVADLVLDLIKQLEPDIRKLATNNGGYLEGLEFVKSSPVWEEGKGAGIKRGVEFFLNLIGTSPGRAFGVLPVIFATSPFGIFFTVISLVFDEKADASGTVSKEDIIVPLGKVVGNMLVELIETGGVVVAELIRTVQLCNEAQLGPRGIFPSGVDQKFPLDTLLVLVDTVVTTFKGLVKAGLFNTLFDSLLSFIDTTGSGRFTQAQLLGIFKEGGLAGALMPQYGGNSAAKNVGVIHLRKFLTELATLFDRNQDGAIDETDLKSFINKAIDLGISSVTILFDTLKAMALPAVIPFINCIFQLKSMTVLKGSNTAFTMKELKKILTLDTEFEPLYKGDDGQMEKTVGVMLGVLATGGSPFSGSSETFLMKEGWSYWEDVIADADGNITKQTFHDQAVLMIEKLLGMSVVTQYVSAMLLQARSYEVPNYYDHEARFALQQDCERQAKEFIPPVAKNLSTCCPLLIDAMFRVFDSTGSGKLTRLEFVRTFGMSSEPSKLPSAIFRFLDEHNNGVVVPEDVEDLIKELATAAFEVVHGIVKTLEPDARSAVLKQITSTMVPMMKGAPFFTEGKGIVIEDAIKFVKKEMDEQSRYGRSPFGGGMSFGHGSHSGPENLMQGFVFGSLYSGLSLTFEMKGSADGTISKEEAVHCVTTILGSMVSEGMIVASSFGISMASQPPRYGGGLAPKDEPLNFPPFFAADSEAKLPMQQIIDFVNLCISTFDSRLKAGSFHKFIEAVFTFVDVNNDGRVSKEECFGIFQAGLAVAASPSIENLTNLGRQLALMFDANNDGAIDSSDIVVFANKIFELLLALVETGVNVAQDYFFAILRAFVDLAFFAKSLTILGGTPKELRAEEADRVAKLYEEADRLRREAAEAAEKAEAEAAAAALAAAEAAFAEEREAEAKAIASGARVFESSHPYDNGADTYETVEFEGALSLNVTFSALCETEANCDFIKFFKDESHYGLFGCDSYTGGLNGSSKNYAPFEIQGNRFVLHFHSDGSVNGWGYKILVTPNYTAPLYGSPLTFETTHPYADGLDTIEIIECDGALSMKIVFDEASRTESGCDYVNFYSTGDSVQRAGPLSGRDGSENFPTERNPLIIPGDKCTWIFHSDGSVNDWGVKFTVTPAFPEGTDLSAWEATVAAKAAAVPPSA